MVTKKPIFLNLLTNGFSKPNSILHWKTHMFSGHHLNNNLRFMSRKPACKKPCENLCGDCGTPRKKPKPCPKKFALPPILACPYDDPCFHCPYTPPPCPKKKDPCCKQPCCPPENPYLYQDICCFPRNPKRIIDPKCPLENCRVKRECCPCAHCGVKPPAEQREYTAKCCAPRPNYEPKRCVETSPECPRKPDCKEITMKPKAEVGCRKVRTLPDCHSK